VSEVRSAERPRSVQCLATLYRLAIFINTHCFRSPKPIKNDVRDKMGTAITSEPAGPTHLPQEYRPHEFRGRCPSRHRALGSPDRRRRLDSVRHRRIVAVLTITNRQLCDSFYALIVILAGVALYGPAISHAGLLKTG
jgi:hypothetical protein